MHFGRPQASLTRIVEEMMAKPDCGEKRFCGIIDPQECGSQKGGRTVHRRPAGSPHFADSGTP